MLDDKTIGERLASIEGKQDLALDQLEKLNGKVAEHAQRIRALEAVGGHTPTKTMWTAIGAIGGAGGLLALFIALAA